MGKRSTSALVPDNGNTGDNAGCAQEPPITNGKTGGARTRYKKDDTTRRKSSEVSPSKKYPLRSAQHSNVRVLRSSSNRKNEMPSVPVNDNIAVQSAVKKRQRGKPLRPAYSSPRVLRSSSKKKNKAPNKPANDNAAIQSAMKKRKRGSPSKGVSQKNEHIKIRQRVRYILNRMNYEQSLIQAYASEGWKGQSLEKIRPEKELERAKAEIMRCKLRIREAFQNMDSLLSEGKLEESLFDSAGEISSEDIFCAICGSVDVTLKNDIILCDGACDRGFHQYCLNPPLLAEDIPPGDEGWFCPACVCKLDCIDVLNELQGSRLSIHDSWEKVFPEAASFANGSKQIDASNLPSDDSADNDYNPGLAEHKVDEERTSAEDGGEGLNSDESLSEDSESSENKKSKTSKNSRTVDDLGLPSDDSEDDDFDPAGPDSDEDQNEKSNSSESDFTSDSDGFCDEIAKSCGQDDVSAPSSSYKRTVEHTNGMEAGAFDSQSNAENSNVAFMETGLEKDMVLPVSSKRQVERLDYKTLYDEAYGKESSGSSDDEEWSGNSTLQKGSIEDSETDSLAESPQPAERCSRRAQARHRNNQHTPQNVRICGSVSEQQNEASGSGSTSRKKHFGPAITQKLKLYFKEDSYPSRATKESLAQELGLTFNQVCKWFSSTRHFSRVVATKKANNLENHTTENNDSIHLREPNSGRLEKLSVDRTDMVSEERMSQSNGNEDTPLRQGINCEREVVVTPTFANQNCTTNSRVVVTPTDVNQNCITPEVGSPKGWTGENQGNGASGYVGSPKGKSSEKKSPGLEYADEARRKAVQRELRKMKTGR